MKMNKKGFTLIEMLVVIAIIAVLVSIIIPTVTSATDRAKAATNAANLRSIKAELVTSMLANGSVDTTKYTVSEDGKTITIKDASIFEDYEPKKVPSGASFSKEAGFSGAVNDLNVTVTWDGLTVAQWAAIAGEQLAKAE